MARLVRGWKSIMFAAVIAAAKQVWDLLFSIHTRHTAWSE